MVTRLFDHKGDVTEDGSIVAKTRGDTGLVTYRGSSGVNRMTTLVEFLEEGVVDR